MLAAKINRAVFSQKRECLHEKAWVRFLYESFCVDVGRFGWLAWSFRKTSHQRRADKTQSQEVKPDSKRLSYTQGSSEAHEITVIYWTITLGQSCAEHVYSLYYLILPTALWKKYCYFHIPVNAFRVHVLPRVSHSQAEPGPGGAVRLWGLGSNCRDPGGLGLLPLFFFFF